MQVVKRGNVIHIIRSKYLRLDRSTGTGGRSRSTSVAKFSADAIEIPQKVLDLLTLDERDKVMAKAIFPARERALQAAEAAALAKAVAIARERDPAPRISTAIELLQEAVRLAEGRLGNEDWTNSDVNVVIQCAVVLGLSTSPSANSARQMLMSLIQGIRTIAEEILSDDFPEMEDEAMKENVLANSWREFKKAIDVLKGALQEKRYVARRNEKSQ